MIDLIEPLKRASLFRDLSPVHLAALADKVQLETYAPGAILFHMGDAGDTMYIIRSGRVRIFMVQADGQEMTFRHYAANDIFGEFSLIDHQPRSASAQAVEPLVVLSLARGPFQDFLREHVEVSLAMMRSLSQRARYTTRYLEEVVHWARQLADGEYEQTLHEINQVDKDEDAQIQGLIQAFSQMVVKVKEREENYERQLTIQIDETRRKSDVRRVIGTGILDKAKIMRAQFENMQKPEDKPED
jgi:CRP-like cAMP-binding protein